VFADPAEAAVFVETLARVKARDAFVLYGWILMSNHYHLLLRTVEVPLWRTMASLQGGFTKRYNRTHDLVGPFWQGRYNAKLVEDQRYFDQLLAYIHLNPVVAGLVSDPAQHRFSGHRELVARSRWNLVDVNEVLDRFGDTRAQARRRYTRALRGARTEAWIGEDPGRLPWWRRERSGAQENATETRSDLPFVDEQGRSTGLERPRLSAGEFVERACAVLGTSLSELASPTRDRETVRNREAIALVAVERYGVRLKHIAETLEKSADTASRWVSRAAARRRDDDAFDAVAKNLDRRLARGEAGDA
jgi:REP element-mobilizing transposase RayT